MREQQENQKNSETEGSPVELKNKTHGKKVRIVLFFHFLMIIGTRLAFTPFHGTIKAQNCGCQ